MHVQLYMAISIDGFIARQNDDTNWVSSTDWDNFRKIIKEAGVIVMGRRTYEVSGSDFPYANAVNIIMTSSPKLLQKQQEGVVFTNDSPEKVVEFAKNKGFEKLLIIGGGKTNARFLKAELIDEIILSVHPLVIGKGIKIFEREEFNTKLEFLSATELNEGLVQIKYKVGK